MTWQRLFAICFIALFAVPLWAADGPEPLPERKITEDEREHWAYQPWHAVEIPDSDDARWSGHPVDRLLHATHLEQSLEPLPAVGRRTLLRRIIFDLVGLPPTAEEIEDFLADESPDAVERLVDRLLASPAYGERWAKHWLDLARFAETDGFEHDLVRPNAWRYRDWVIEALTRDMPYDEFVRDQIAGDEIHPKEPAAAIATGFLLCGPDMPDINLQEERRHFVLNEMTSTVGSAILGLQFGCAQCHDHKYDPISIHDFYRLRAFFESADIFRDHPIPTAEQLAAREEAEAAWTPEVRNQEKRRKELESLGRKRLRERNPDEKATESKILAELSKEERVEHTKLVKALKDVPPLPELPLGRVMKTGDTRPAYLYLRGDFRNKGPELQSGYPRILAEDSPANHSRTSLAGWLVDPSRPLAARVIANRVWQWHFGRGLSETSSDFGVMGEEPDYLDLLDWLARRFIDDGWSFKATHRLLVTSEAYKVASVPFDLEWSEETIERARQIAEQSSESDPDNRYRWRRERLRLDGESIRDGMLLVSGQLSTSRGGEAVRPPLPPEVTSTLLKNQWPVSRRNEEHRRRSIYIFVRRNLRYPMFDVFDRPDTNASCAVRHESTTATQSLVLWNSSFSLDCSRYLAGELLESGDKDVSTLIDEAYERIFARHATTEEMEIAKSFLGKQAKLLEAEGRTGKELALPIPWREGADERDGAAFVDLCLALFNASEFIYID